MPATDTVTPYGAAWSCAVDAASVIDDLGPDQFVAGSTAEARAVSRQQAQIEFHARRLLVELDARPGALDQAVAATRADLTGGYLRLIRDQLQASRAEHRPWTHTWGRLQPGQLRAHRRIQRLGFELAHTARTLVAAASADHDPDARARLLAATGQTVTDRTSTDRVADAPRAEGTAAPAGPHDGPGPQAHVTDPARNGVEPGSHPAQR